MGCCDSKPTAPPKQKKRRADDQPSKAGSASDASDRSHHEGAVAWVVGADDISEKNAENVEIAEVRGEVALLSHTGSITELVTSHRQRADDPTQGVLHTAMLVDSSPFWGAISLTLQTFPPSIHKNTPCLLFATPKHISVICAATKTARSYTITPFRPLRPSRLARDFEINSKTRYKVVSAERGRILPPAIARRRNNVHQIGYNCVRDSEVVYLVSWHNRVKVNVIGAEGNGQEMSLAVPENGSVSDAFRTQVTGPSIPFVLTTLDVDAPEATSDCTHEVRLSQKTVQIVFSEGSPPESVVFDPHSQNNTLLDRLAAIPASLHTSPSPGPTEAPLPALYRCVEEGETYYAVPKKTLVYVNGVAVAHDNEGELAVLISESFEVDASNMVLEKEKRSHDDTHVHLTLRVEKLPVQGDARERGAPHGEIFRVDAITKPAVSLELQIPEHTFFLKKNMRYPAGRNPVAAMLVLVPLSVPVNVVFSNGSSREALVNIHPGGPHRGNLRNAITATSAMPTPHIENSDFSLQFGSKKVPLKEFTWSAIASLRYAERAQPEDKVVTIVVLPKIIDVTIPGSPPVQIEVFYGEATKTTFHRLVEGCDLHTLCDEKNISLTEISMDQSLAHADLPRSGGAVKVVLPLKRAVLCEGTYTRCVTVHPHWSAQSITSRIGVDDVSYEEVRPGSRLLANETKSVRLAVEFPDCDVRDSISIDVGHTASLLATVVALYGVKGARISKILSNDTRELCATSDLEYEELDTRCPYVALLEL